MPQVYLSANEQFSLTSTATVFGSSGVEKTIIITDTTNAILDQNIEQVDFQEKTSNFSYQQTGNALQVFSNNVLIVKMTVPESGSLLTFTNGSVALSFSSTQTLLFGGTAVSSVAGAVIPEQIDSSSVSIFSLTRPAANVISDEVVDQHTIDPINLLGIESSLNVNFNNVPSYLTDI